MRRMIVLMMCLLLMGMALCTQAEPMPTPTLKQALQQSTDIIVAKYEAVLHPEEARYFGGVPARYRVEKVLKSDSHIKVGTTQTIRYEFHDGSPCMDPPDWQFSEKQEMPAKGSRWILFLMPAPTPGRPSLIDFLTFRGDYGRMPADAKTLAEVQKALQQSQ